MALSFQDSLKAAQAEAQAKALAEAQAVHAVAAPAEMPDVMAFDTYGIATTDYGIAMTDESGAIAAYSGDGGSWTQDSTGRYDYYREYSDDNISTVDIDKNISLHPKQTNITMEENSQFIPFEMNRYFDGYDLTNATFSIHYVTSDGYHGVSKPINVSFNNEKIRFGWLVDSFATHIAGLVKFEIHATGINSKGDAYVWKSKHNDKLNVLESICSGYEEVIDLDSSWVKELIEQVVTNVSDKIVEAEVSDQVTLAQNAAAYAQSAVTTVEGLVTAAQNAADAAAGAASTTVESMMADYAKTADVELKIASMDISGKLVEYAKTADVAANYYSKTEHDAIIGNLGTIVDEESGEERPIETVAEAIANVDVSKQIGDLGEAATVKEYVDTAVANVDVTEQLGDLGTAEDGVTPITVKEYVDTAVSKVDLTGYATETYVENKVGTLSSSITTNASDIASLGDVVKDLQEEVGGIDKSPRLTYKIVYNDTTDENVGENVLVLYD